MTGMAVVLTAAVAISGLVVAAAALAGVIPEVPPRTRASSARLRAVTSRIRRVSRRTWLTAGGGVLLGAALMFLLRWPILVLLVPLATVGLPRLLSDPPPDEIRLLEALDRWVRSMLAQLSTGKSITDALRLSARQATKLLAEPLSLLIRRLDDRWTVPQALQAMADELASPDSDAVLAALILSTQRGGTGASVTLASLADSIQDRLRALREIEAERAKPRIVVRQVTTIMVVALVGFMVLSPDFFTPYGTPLGQVILVALLAAYVGSVATMRRMTISRSRDRVLRPLS